MTHFHSELVKLTDFSKPPGEMLQTMLDEMGINQLQLHKLIGRPFKTINEIIKGKCMITARTAIELEMIFGVSAEYWMLREARYQLHLERNKRGSNGQEKSST